MAKSRSTQHDLDKIRKPRVHLTYDVETGGALEMKELPFVVGVMADLSGYQLKDEDGKKIKVKDRKFVNIDRDNLNDVLAGSKPEVSARVANKLTGEGQLNVALKFKHMDDFHPDNVVKQVEPLRKLVEARQRLTDLKGKLDGNDKLEGLLTKVLNDSGQLGELKDAIGITDPKKTEES